MSTEYPQTDALFKRLLDFRGSDLMGEFYEGVAKIERENQALKITVDTLGKHHRGIQDSRNDYARNYYAAKVELANLTTFLRWLRERAQEWHMSQYAGNPMEWAKSDVASEILAKLKELGLE